MNLIARWQCWSIENILDLYVDGRLTAPVMTAVELHLKSCRGCSQTARSLEPIKASSFAVTPPPDLAASILRAFEEGAADPRPAFQLLWSPAHTAALLYLCLLAGGHTLPGAGHQGPPRPSVSGESQ